MRKHIKFCIVAIITLHIFSCRLNKEQSTDLSKGTKPALFQFVDSTAGSKIISTLDPDGLFNQISQIDMDIQMKAEKPYASREKSLNAYKKFLATEVSEWADQDIESMSKIFTEVKRLCDTISPRIFPAGVRLIKIKTNHYGQNVYYTRGNVIFIPENIFPIENQTSTRSVMLHEIFHILSRQNPEFREQVYALIGFQKAEKPVQLNTILNNRLLTNPDGVSFQYYIRLDSIKAIPLITSKFDSYSTQKNTFFDYLQFDLYVLNDKKSYFEVITDKAGTTTLPLKNTPSFFTKIKDNTQYIIHPDEILADNFMLALEAYSNNEYHRFSEKGKILITDLLNILQKW